jgi:hypothetical protein
MNSIPSAAAARRNSKQLPAAAKSENKGVFFVVPLNKVA